MEILPIVEIPPIPPLMHGRRQLSVENVIAKRIIMIRQSVVILLLVHKVTLTIVPVLLALI